MEFIIPRSCEGIFGLYYPAEKTITFENNKPHGLLSDKERTFIYVQSSGANIPWLLRPTLSKGLNYVHVVMKFIGISTFDELLVDGTVQQEKNIKAP